MQIKDALVLVDFHVLDIKLNWNSSLLLRRAFMVIVGAVCNMQTNQLCLTLIDPNVYYGHLRVVKTQTTYNEMGDDPGFIAACYNYFCEEREGYGEPSIDNLHQPTIKDATSY